MDNPKEATQQPAEPENNNSQDLEIVFTRNTDADWFLQLLVKILNSGGDTFLITLNVGGLLISGALIGGKEYFDLMADYFGGIYKEYESNNKEAGETVDKAIRSLGETYSPANSSSNSNNNEPHYIHLRNAKFYSPISGQGMPGSEGVLWRGRLESVDGFFIGGFHIPYSDEELRNAGKVEN